MVRAWDYGSGPNKSHRSAAGQTDPFLLDFLSTQTHTRPENVNFFSPCFLFNQIQSGIYNMSISKNFTVYYSYFPK